MNVVVGTDWESWVRALGSSQCFPGGGSFGISEPVGGKRSRFSLDTHSNLPHSGAQEEGDAQAGDLSLLG